MAENKIRLDFRSDTVTKPTAGMRAAMASAEVGDDVYGEDPTVNRLEARAAEIFKKEASLFLPSGTQANLSAILSHCQRGEEYICGQGAHTYLWEGGGVAVLGGVQPHPLPNQPDGTITLDDLEGAIKPDDAHFAISRLIGIENTIGGRVLPLDYIAGVVALARKHGLSLHLDGARVFNAAVASGVDVATIAEPFDTVSACLSKGLGAPIGSVLVGSVEAIRRARRLRKMLGGGWRQAGFLAAAGLYALDHHINRLAIDHDNARRLAKGFSGIAGLTVEPAQTNIVFVDVAPSLAESLSTALGHRGIGAAAAPGGRRMRWVTHLDVDQAAVDEAIATVREVAAGSNIDSYHH